MTPYEILLCFGGGAGAMTAIMALLSRFTPIFRIGGRVGGNENRITKLENMYNESRAADRLIVRAMVAIIDNQITNNGHDRLRKTKDELMVFLQNS